MHIAFITFKMIILLTEVRIQSVFACDGKTHMPCYKASLPNLVVEDFFNNIEPLKNV
jgi:hypothetical protein